MINRLMITAATAALIAGTGLANAQGMGGGREGGAAGGTGMQQSAPSAPAASPSSGAASHEGSPGMKASQSEEKGGAANRSAQQDMKSGGERHESPEKHLHERGDDPCGIPGQLEPSSALCIRHALERVVIHAFGDIVDLLAGLL